MIFPFLGNQGEYHFLFGQQIGGNFLPMITSLRGNMCHRSGEKMDHLLLHCNVAYSLWSVAFGAIGIH
jgi:hypothetical protein